MTKHLFIGGLVAAGFDPTCAYLLVISHSGRGVFAVSSWDQVARDPTLAYPEDGRAVGIGPIDGVSISVKVIDYDTGVLRFTSPDGKLSFKYEDGSLTVTDENA